MIQTQTILKVSDNSGAKTVKCIKVLGGFKKKYAKLGNFIIVSIQQLKNKIKKTSKVKKGEVYKALIVKTKKTHKKIDGSFVSFAENSVILVNKQENPLSTRIISPLPKALKKKRFQKFISISPGLV